MKKKKDSRLTYIDYLNTKIIQQKNIERIMFFDRIQSDSNTPK